MKATLFVRYPALLFGLGLFGVLCGLWLPIALLLGQCPSTPQKTQFGRNAVKSGFGLYLWILERLGLLSIDLSRFSLEHLNRPVLLAPNHPSLLDAIIILSKCPGLSCVLKSDLLKNPLIGPGAQLAGYISNYHPRQMIHAVEREIRSGQSVLLFPEGTRTQGALISELKLSPALIARRLGCDIQTVLIDSNSGFLGKNWPWYRPPELPLRITLIMGEHFAPEPDVRALTRTLRNYYFQELIQLTAEPHP